MTVFRRELRTATPLLQFCRDSFVFSILENVEEAATAKNRNEIEENKHQMENLPEAKRLQIATIFSYSVNEEENDDYNRLFSTTYDTSSDKFQNYNKDVSLRMKNREIDILIVVNMFLAGFDATTLNTLWVDKNLK